jgi:hypothetical protein
MNFSMQVDLVEIPIRAKLQDKIRKYYFFENLGPLHGSLETQHMKNLIASRNLSRNSNPFRVFPRKLFAFYKQKIIEIGRGHLGRFPRQF